MDRQPAQTRSSSSSRALTIVLAPDAFKGSMEAQQVCAAMAEGVRRVVPEARILALPLADGGEGTTAALMAAAGRRQGGRWQSVEVTGPLPSDRPRLTAQIGLLGDGRSVVLEMASASGLPHVPEALRNPLHTTSYGTGELIAAALATGARHLILGIGGSATNDLGAGMAQALGVRFLRADGTAITAPMTGGLWAEVDRLDLTGLNPALAHCHIEVACDVDNPLLGRSGCAAVYGPQKGATAEIVDRLEANLRRGADLVEAAIGARIRDQPGAGAAGGLGAGLVAFLGARLRPGIALVLEASGLEAHLQGADLVVTGEGRLDAQTAHGKTISGVAQLGRRWGVPVVAIVGSLGDGLEALYPLGLTSAFSLVPGPLSLAEAMAQGPALVADTTERVLRLLVAGQTREWGSATTEPSAPIP